MIYQKSLKQRLIRILYLVLPTAIKANYWVIIPRNVLYEIAMYVAVPDIVRSTNSKCCNPVGKFEEKLAYTIFH